MCVIVLHRKQTNSSFSSSSAEKKGRVSSVFKVTNCVIMSVFLAAVNCLLTHTTLSHTHTHTHTEKTFISYHEQKMKDLVSLFF